MLHQLRTYEIFEHNRAAFLQRFEEHAWRIMKGYGFDVLAFWETKEDGSPYFAYLLSWPDEASKDEAWGGFMADKEWADIKVASSQVHGKMVGSIRDQTLRPTSFSPDLSGASCNRQPT